MHKLYASTYIIDLTHLTGGSVSCGKGEETVPCFMTFSFPVSSGNDDGTMLLIAEVVSLKVVPFLISSPLLLLSTMCMIWTVLLSV